MMDIDSMMDEYPAATRAVDERERDAGEGWILPAIDVDVTVRHAGNGGGLLSSIKTRCRIDRCVCVDYVMSITKCTHGPHRRKSAAAFS